MRELHASDLTALVAEGSWALLSCLSFEDRSLAVADAILSAAPRLWLCLLNEDIETDVSEMRRRAEETAANANVQLHFLSSSKRDPLVLADAMVEVSREYAVDEGVSWVADITTMTHEMLLVVVAAAEEIIPAWRNLRFVYNIAGRYSGDDDVSTKWISRGIHDLRSVIGFPGERSPGEPTTLVALPGFDSERMRRVVEEIEPEHLLVGISCTYTERHAWSAEKNRDIAAKLLNTRDGGVFEYAALDPFAAVDAVIDATRNVQGNILIAPLNSKISTVAIGVLARRRKEWQLCYAPALIYNLDYSTRSDCFLSCTMTEMLAHVDTKLAETRKS
jgi:hypothetical protein